MSAAGARCLLPALTVASPLTAAGAWALDFLVAAGATALDFDFWTRVVFGRSWARLVAEAKARARATGTVRAKRRVMQGSLATRKSPLYSDAGRRGERPAPATRASGGGLAVDERVVGAIERRGRVRRAVRLERGGAELGGRERGDGVLAVAGDQQRPGDARVGAADALLVRHRRGE